MPCFAGLAVSIHAPGALEELSISRQQRHGRITSYIPVPDSQLGPDGLPQQSTFAVSITLLSPGMRVPYSSPAPTVENPYPPPPLVVGGLPGTTPQRGQYISGIKPFVPSTGSASETVAAYIYFDGRQKEEVATLLRRGEETWVNSRWVSVPDDEGGGIAEREFLFREVGLERWLNGLDLGASADKARKLERRQKKLEKRRRLKQEEMDSDDDSMNPAGRATVGKDGVLRYGGDGHAAHEPVIKDEDLLSQDSSDDEPPEPEASGQIKVALYRVLASGEIKRGEYSPQFDVHDDEGPDANAGNDAGEDVDHTTSFAKPKHLDPKSISTQTVTGIDPPERPYAVFTFFYRGKKQLEKMGILPETEVKVAAPSTAKRKTVQTDFSKLGPLNNTGTKGFSSYRDKNTPSKKVGAKNSDDDAMDSDDENDDDEPNQVDDDDKTEGEAVALNPEDLEVAEGVRQIKLKRQHSAEALDQPPQSSTLPKAGPSTSNSAEYSSTTGGTNTPNSLAATAGTPNEKPSIYESLAAEESIIGSPLKKHRPSIGLEGVLGGGDSAATINNAATSAWNENRLEIPAAALAGMAGRFGVAPASAAGRGQGTMASMSESIRQTIAAATALPDEDEEL